MLVVIQNSHPCPTDMLVHDVYKGCDRTISGTGQRLNGVVIKKFNAQVYILIQVTALRETSQLKASPLVI